METDEVLESVALASGVAGAVLEQMGGFAIEEIMEFANGLVSFVSSTGVMAGVPSVELGVVLDVTGALKTGRYHCGGNDSRVLLIPLGLLSNK